MLNMYNIKIQYNAWTIPPLRTYDVYIMEVAGELGLTKVQLEQINTCRMFLQITTLADMMDHMGGFLLPHAFLQTSSEHRIGLESLSTSTLMWPEISNPTKAMWKLWTKTICMLFTGDTNGTQLRQPLGAWTSNFQKYWDWKWRMPTADRLLNRRSNMANPRSAILTKTQQHCLTFSLTIPTNQEFQGMPVTPHDTQ